MSIDHRLVQKIRIEVDRGQAIRAFHYAIELLDRKYDHPVWLVSIVADLHIQIPFYYAHGTTQTQRKEIVKTLYKSIDSITETVLSEVDYNYFMGALKPLIGKKVLA